MSDSKAGAQIKCQNCGAPFTRRKQAGRRPKYCSPPCRSAAFRERHTEPAPAEFARETERIGQAVASRARMVAQTSALPVLTWPLEPLRHSVALQRELDDFIAVAVREALARGADWDEIAAVTSVSTSSLKNRYSRAQVTRAVRARNRRRPRRPSAPAALLAMQMPTESEAKAAEDAQWNAQDALARALSYLYRASGRPVRAIASEAGISPSYAYRLMTGERHPSWEAVRTFTLACGNDPDDLVDLWNAADGRPAPAPAADYHLALARFRSALRGLHLAEARPDPVRLTSDLPGASNSDAHVVQTLLTAQRTTPAETLSWPVTAALTAALRGSQSRISQYWQALRDTAPRPQPRIFTQAFG
ncbi:zinc ribbon domain-containing protein [Streptomyces sp. 372A]